MGRGRKPGNKLKTFDWQTIYKANVGYYLEAIIRNIIRFHTLTHEDGADLLRKITKGDKSRINSKQDNKDKVLNTPNNWAWCNLGAICSKIGSGSTPKGSDYSSDGIPFFRSQNIHNHNLVFDDIKYISNATQTKMRGTIVEPEDILLNITGGSMGRCSLVPKDFKSGNVSQHVCIIRPTGVNNAFYHKLFLTPYFQKLIFSSTTGSGREGLPKYNLEGFLIPIPPLSEQEIIVAFLNELQNEEIKPTGKYLPYALEKQIIELHKSQLKAMQIIASCDKQLSLIEKLNQAILQDAIQGKLVPQNFKDEPANEILKRIKSEKAQIAKTKQLSPIKIEEIPFEIPKTWTWVRLGEISKQINDGTHHTPRYTLKGIPFLSIKDISSGFIDFSSTKYISEEEHKTLIKRCYPQKNDILFCRIGTLGRPSIINTDVEFSIFVSLGLIKTYSHLYNVYYIKYVLDSPFLQNQYLKIKADGIHTPKLNLKDVPNLLIPLPPVGEQKRIVIEIEKQFAKTKQLKENILANQQATEQLLKVLLHEGFQVKDSINEVHSKTRSLVISIKTKKCTSAEKAILAGHIINLTNKEDFGRVKFQKLLHLTEYHFKLDLGSNYLQNVAGPHDGEFIADIEATLKQFKFFDIRKSPKDGKVNYTPLSSAKQLDTLFKENFKGLTREIDGFLSKFRNSTWDQCEIVSTLYAVWNNRLIKKKSFDDKALKADFLKWDKKKAKYKDRLDNALAWMRKEGIVPEGWGKLIEKPKKTK